MSKLWQTFKCWIGYHGESYRDFDRLPKPKSDTLKSLFYSEGWRCKWCQQEKWY